MTLQAVVRALPALARRRAVGLHTDLALRWWTYGRLHRQIAAVARYLHDCGVGRGDRIALWATNSPEWAAAFFGAVMRGAVAVLVDSDTEPSRVAEIAAGERCRLVFCDAVPSGVATSDAMSWVPLTSIDAVDDVGADGRALDDLAIAVDEDDPVALLFSSGTTASPTGVLLSHRNVMCQIEPFRPWRRVLFWIPVRMLVLPPASHVLGLVVGLVLPLTIGLSIVYTAGARAATWARVIRDHRILLALAVPRVLQVLERHVRSLPLGRRRRSLDDRLREAGRVGRVWWPFWARGEVFGRPIFRLFLVGGAHLPPDTARFWRRTCLLVVQGYGLAETSGIVSLSNPFAWNVGDVGKPSRARHVEIAPDGEILVRGDHIALSSRPGVPLDEAASELLATGDLGRIDRRGRLTILGRKKDVIVTSEGFNVHPDRVEAALIRQDGVLDGAVISAPRDGGEEVHAVLRLAGGTDPSAAVRSANQQLPPQEWIRSWSLWPDESAIPRNRMGKVVRADVASRVQPRPGDHDTPDAPGPVTRAQIVSEQDRGRRVRLVARYLLQSHGAADAEDAADLRVAEDLGLSSLDIVEVIALVERADGAPLTPFVAPGATLAGLRAQLRSPADRMPAAEAWIPSGPAPWTRPLQWLQPIVRPLATSIWAFTNVAIDSSWEIDPRRLDGPLVIAAAPHRHWLDAFAVSRALPWRFARKLHLLVEHDFGEHFRPAPETPLRRRLSIALVYYAGLPALFPFTVLLPHGRTRDALIDAARRLDRGRLLLSFPKGLAHPYIPPRAGLGIARLAIEAGCPIVPVHIDSEHVSFAWRWRRPRQRIGVHIGTPIPVAVHTTPEIVAAELDASFARLRSKIARWDRD